MKARFLKTMAFALAAGGTTSLASAQSIVTLAPNNGSGGVFLQLTPAAGPVTVTSFASYFSSAAGTPVSVEVWVRPGAYTGFTASNVGWTLSETVVGTSAGTAVLSGNINLANPIVVPAGGPTSIYFHAITAGGGIRYQGTGTTATTTFSNSDVTLFTNIARTGAVAFGGTQNTPRAFSGAINYSLGGTLGGCCLTSGPSNCVVTTQTGCTNQGGTYAGDGSDCTTANCPPLPTGACCRNDGTCDVVTQNQCTTTGGTYSGDNVTCAAANCPPAGACCFFATCSLLTSAACTASAGTWQGAGSACGTCPAVPPVFYSNCNISTGPTTLSGVPAPAGATWSECARDEANPTTLTNTTAGLTFNGTFRLADDFVVPAGGLNLAYVKVFGYTTGATTPGATAATLRILDGSPAGTPNVVFGDTTTNRMAHRQFSDIYRCFPTTVGLGSGAPCVNAAAGAPDTTRRLQEIYISVNQFLPAGTYWLDYNATGVSFAPPATQADATGRQCNPNNSNALQSNAGVWGPANDGGHGCFNGVAVNNPAGTNPINVQQDMYFELLGTAGGVPCYADCDGVGGLTANDFACFLSAYVNGQSYADCDGIGGLTANDFICFLTNYNNGCS